MLLVKADLNKKCLFPSGVANTSVVAGSEGCSASRGSSRLCSCTQRAFPSVWMCQLGFKGGTELWQSACGARPRGGGHWWGWVIGLALRREVQKYGIIESLRLE